MATRSFHCPFFTGIVVIAATGLAGIRGASAHEGPPFPILVDEPALDFVVSVWADPDIGDAQFYIVLESLDGRAPRSTPDEVTMWIEPVSGRLPRVEIPAERQEMRNQLQYSAEPYFDQRDEWNIGIHLKDASGSTHELTTRVTSTPPGYGPWDLIIYLFPFLLLAGFWAVAMRRRKMGTRHGVSTRRRGGVESTSLLPR